MKGALLSLLLCMSFVLLIGVQVKAGSLADILKEKGIIRPKFAWQDIRKLTALV